ncbi:hypothetical protein FA95DRAFT_1566869 [Auriscalpium vulgare]|uniref:Uncharacterized protein n=1 Tax=Auriscalpium vulgare TaxID=40419 RepID=A0ACB8R7A0_9AGAM|nr:hypothetical protein FA95DRAFT_1566869 [Auriscalpium vulgare]
MRSTPRVVLVISLVVAAARAQQLVTTTNALGLTIVEQITTDALGETITNILQTLPAGVSTALPSTPAPTSPAVPTSTTPASTTPASTTPISTAQITTTPDQVGPVGTPAPLPTDSETPFVYLTTDANGNTIQVSATFTPTFAPSQPYTPVTTGTILGYSEWLSQIGNATANLNLPVSTSGLSGAPARIERGFLGVAVAGIASLVAGAVLLVA